MQFQAPLFQAFWKLGLLLPAAISLALATLMTLTSFDRAQRSLPGWKVLHSARLPSHVVLVRESFRSKWTAKHYLYMMVFIVFSPPRPAHPPHRPRQSNPPHRPPKNAPALRRQPLASASHSASHRGRLPASHRGPSCSHRGCVVLRRTRRVSSRLFLAVARQGGEPRRTEERFRSHVAPGGRFRRPIFLAVAAHVAPRKVS